jgi:general secretion pathway protein E
MELQHRTLEQLLLEQGRITPDDLRKVKRLQQERGERLERMLLDLGFISEEDLLPLLATYHGVAAVHRKEFPQVPVPLGSLSLKYLRRAKVMPLGQENGTLTVAMPDPADFYTIQALQLATGLEIVPRLARERDVLEGLELAYGNGDGKAGEAADGGDAELEFLSDDEEDVNHLRDLASEAPVIRLVNLLISRAVEQRASDIHIEPFENELKVRYRIDGVLHDVETPARRLQAAIVSRIKIMAKLNIAERRLPQDGRIKLRLMGREIDLRVSTLPTLYGESVVLRILDRSSISVKLETLGFPEDTLKEFEQIIERPYGMIPVTGPTGSGKTTTLYSALQALASPEVNVVTIEDPIEMVLEDFNQIAANPKTGTSFAEALRHVLRQDPDVVMVGEVRDGETAAQAVQAALTGHMVLSTLHTNDTVGAIARLRDLGVPGFLVAATLTGVVAQRLVRQVCPSCATDLPLTADEVHALGVPHPEDHAGKLIARRGQGCTKCRYTGFYGRSGIFEVLAVNPRLRHLIAEGATPEVLQRTARQDGLRSLREHAIRKVAAGATSFEEAMRATADVEGGP